MISQIMNNIEKDQNKEENLLLLFSQKTLYNKSKSIKYFVIFLAIVNFLLGIVSKIIDLHKIIPFLKVYLQFFHNVANIYVLYCNFIRNYVIF